MSNATRNYYLKNNNGKGSKLPVSYFKISTMRLISVILIISTLLSGCFKGNENRCEYEDCAVKAPAAEISAVQDYLSANNITATQHCSGVFYRIENAGTGNKPSACSNVAARYVGRLTSGAKFDESGANAVNFNLQNVIRGWTNTVPLINAGGRIILYIPPSLAYGSREVKDQSGAVIIPANSILIFEIDLVAAQ